MPLIRRGQCPVPGTALAYEITGEGPPVVFLHGRAMDRTVWDPQALVLAEQFMVIRYDLRGFGESAPADVPYTHSDDLGLLLDALQLDQAALVGISTGGGAAINFTLSQPERVTALVTVDTSLGGFDYSDALENAHAKVADTAKSAGVDAARREWLALPLFDAARNHPGALTVLERMVARYSGWHWTHRDPGQPQTVAAIGRLWQITTPTLVITGDLDMEDFHRIGAELVLRIPRVEQVRLQNAGHLPNLENEGAFNAVILDFLRRVLPELTT